MRLSILFACFCAYAAEPAVVWKQPAAQAELIAPEIAGPMAHIVENTINYYSGDKFGWTLPVARSAGSRILSIVAGNGTNNPSIAELGREGFDVGTKDLGQEGFRIVTYEKGHRQYVILLAQTPAGLKFACQELVFFHMPATKASVSIDWPMDIRRTPQFAYRGIYMLPCWAQHDST